MFIVVSYNNKTGEFHNRTYNSTSKLATVGYNVKRKRSNN